MRVKLCVTALCVSVVNNSSWALDSPISLYPPSYPGGCLQNNDFVSCFFQHFCGNQPSYSGADDNNLLAVVAVPRKAALPQSKQLVWRVTFTTARPAQIHPYIVTNVSICGEIEERVDISLETPRTTKGPIGWSKKTAISCHFYIYLSNESVENGLNFKAESRQIIHASMFAPP